MTQLDSQPLERGDTRAPRYLFFIESNTTGSGMQALRAAREMGLEPVLFTRDRSRYRGVEATGCAIVPCETNLVQELRGACADFVRAFPGTVAGITTTSEFYVETVALIASEYGTPTNAPDMIRACRNKARTREVLTAAGLPQPRFTLVRCAEETAAAVGLVGLPCVIKPCDDTASYGVKLCRSVGEAQEAVGLLLQRHTNVRGQPVIEAVLCEEYIDAPEFSVEMFAWQGDITCVGITQKRLAGLPHFIEVGHIFPAQLPPEQWDALESTTRQALGLLGNLYGPTHTEVKLTDRGGVIIEINPRLAGGMIPELMIQARGLNLLDNQLLAACGRPPELTPTRSCWAGIHFLTAPAEGRFAGVQNLDQLQSDPDVVQVDVTAAAGAAVRPPLSAYDRLGFVIARADTYADMLRKLEWVRQTAAVAVAPAGTQETGEQ